MPADPAPLVDVTPGNHEHVFPWRLQQPVTDVKGGGGEGGGGEGGGEGETGGHVSTKGAEGGSGNVVSRYSQRYLLSEAQSWSDHCLLRDCISRMQFPLPSGSLLAVRQS